MVLSVVATYDNFYIANGAVRELIDYGFPRENIRIYTRQRGASEDEAGESMEIIEGAALVQSARLPGANAVGAQIGAGIGASVGLGAGLLSLFGMMYIPGVEDLGALAAALSAGALGGAVLGEAVGSLLGFGIPMEEAERYAESLRHSDVLVKIHAEPYTTRLVDDVLRRYRPHRIDQKAVEPSDSRWSALAQRVQPATARIFRR